MIDRSGAGLEAGEAGWRLDDLFRRLVGEGVDVGDAEAVDWFDNSVTLTC